MLKKVLYLSNIEVPYRARLFSELAKYCDLTVLYERERSSNRDAAWCQSEKREYRVEFLNGLKIGNENSFSLRIFQHLFSGYDRIIIGCYNSKIQMLAMMALRLMRKSYILNIDGEVFVSKKGIKSALKRFFLRGAAGYLAAGEKSAETLRKVVDNKPVTVYYFSSLSKAELEEHAQDKSGRNATTLVVGQYFDYKGMDIAAEAARKDPDHEYLFVGMGKRTELFVKEQGLENVRNIQVIPFLQKKDLEQLYKECAMLVLPSRQECWGLVINEAASFGTPIVSTWGSGAAVEFMADQYAQYLAAAGDADSLLEAIGRLRACNEKEDYSQYLKEKSQRYCIETNCRAHLHALAIQEETE